MGWPYENIRAAFPPIALAHVGSVIQWASFTGLVALAVIGHVRYAAAMGADAFADAGLRFRIAAGYAALLALGYVAFLWAPVSVFTTITHDSFIFFDSTYRIANGLAPSRDFPTALGAATMYLPAWAAILSGGYGGSVEMASVWVALGLGIACAVIGAARMPLALHSDAGGRGVPRHRAGRDARPLGRGEPDADRWRDGSARRQPDLCDVLQPLGLGGADPAIHGAGAATGRARAPRAFRRSRRSPWC